MTNDYKTDKNKPPLLDALRPFAPALVALARMMDDMQHKHRLAGATDPFSAWKKLPRAKNRLANGLARHVVENDPWALNTADALAGKDAHLHATHGLFNLLGALTVHLEDNAKACCGAADAKADDFALTPDGRQLADVGISAATGTGAAVRKVWPNGYCGACDTTRLERAHGVGWTVCEHHAQEDATKKPIHGPAGADWREPSRCGERGPQDWLTCMLAPGHEGSHQDGAYVWGP